MSSYREGVLPSSINKKYIRKLVCNLFIVTKTILPAKKTVSQNIDTYHLLIDYLFFLALADVLLILLSNPSRFPATSPT